MGETYKNATFDLKDGVGEFTMTRPDLMNALTEDLRRDIQQMLDRVQGNDEVRCLILRGEGRAFSAGGDIKGMKERAANNFSPVQARARMLSTHDWLERLHNIDCPVIAAVDGYAFGGGLSLALLSDFVLATPRAKFCSVFGRIGLVPDMGVVYTLPRVVGMSKAKEMMYTCRTVDAAEALELGIVHSLHEPDDLLPAARDMAACLAKGSKAAIASTKRIANRSLQASYRDVAEWEADAQAMMFATDYHREAVRRFLEKEPALFNWDEMSG